LGRSFADVTLVSDDQNQVQAHKFMLSACSPVLNSLLMNNPHPHPLLYMRGIKLQELQAILEFMYLGRAYVSNDRIVNFMTIAQDLGIKELASDDERTLPNDNRTLSEDKSDYDVDLQLEECRDTLSMSTNMLKEEAEEKVEGTKERLKNARYVMQFIQAKVALNFTYRQSMKVQSIIVTSVYLKHQLLES